jgi:hypothetical protein
LWEFDEKHPKQASTYEDCVLGYGEQLNLARHRGLGVGSGKTSPERTVENSLTMFASIIVDTPLAKSNGMHWRASADVALLLC